VPEFTGTPRDVNVLIEVVGESHSSIEFLFTESNSKKGNVGYIRAVGPKCREDLRVGELVLFDLFAAYGEKIKLLDEETGEVKEYILIKDADVRMHLRNVRA
jgi:hypothetical protein